MKKKIESENEGKRLDLFIYESLKQEGYAKLTRTIVQNFLEDGCLVNGQVLKKSYKLKVDDEIDIDTQFWSNIEEDIDLSEDIRPEEGDLDIRYEDEDLLVIYKPKGLVVHPGVGNVSNTLANYLRSYLEKKSEYDQLLDRSGIVHRLDRGVSGLMVVAKRKESQEYLKKEFQERSVVKIYHANIDRFRESSLPSFKEFEQISDVKKYLENMDISFEPWKEWYKMRGYIGRSSKNRYKMEFKPYEFGGSKIAESYILKSGNQALIKIETGRMHQIRASLEYLGLHIKGDNLYGPKSMDPLSEYIELEAVLLSFRDMKGEVLIFKV